MVEQSKEVEEFSKFGHTLVTLYMEPEAIDNMADKLIRDCYFVVKSLRHRKELTFFTSSTPVPNGLCNGTAPPQPEISNNQGAMGGVANAEVAPPTARKRRGMMAMLTKASAQANPNKK